MWRSVSVDPDTPYADGKWRFMMYDTEFSSGFSNDKRCSADRDSLADVIGKYPLFASALKAEEFRELFLVSLKRIGSEDLARERVNETLDLWQKEWQRLMDDHFQRFGDHLKRWTKEAELTREFYAERYDFIIPYAEERLKQY